MNNSAGQMAETDVNEIRDLFGTCHEQARSLQEKAFALHSPDKDPGPTDPESTAPSVGEEFKGQLRRLRDIQSRTLNALNGFC